MKNYLGSLKILFQGERGGGLRKTNIQGELPGVAGLGQFANLRGGGLGKKEECGVFEGGGGGGDC